MSLNDNYFNKIVFSLFNLYVVNRNRYLIMFQDGHYKTEIWHKDSPDNKKNAKPLFDFHFKAHLRKKYTVGVFATDYITKFICFDIDVKDIKLAQNVVNALVSTLNRFGIKSDYIFVSWSGNKGYHVEVFFRKPIKNYIADGLFTLIVSEAKLTNINYGQVEFLPTATKGVKVPLGINFKNETFYSNMCYYVDFENAFKMIKKKEFIFNIKKIEPQLIIDIVENNKGKIDRHLKSQRFRDSVKKQAKADLAKQNNPVPINQNTANKPVTIDELLLLENNGLIKIETRHTSLFNIARLFKCHYGHSQDQCEKKLIEWMYKQDKKYYKTPLSECVEEIKRMVDCIYKNNYQLSVGNYVVDIWPSEIEEVLKVKSKNGKLLLFVLLIHSKKHAKPDGTFFMTFQQMVEATGLCEKTCRNQLNKLVEGKFVKVISRNVPADEGTFKKPNVYKLLIPEAKKEDEPLNINMEQIDQEITKKLFLNSLKLVDQGYLKRELNKKDFSNYKNGKYFKK